MEEIFTIKNIVIYLLVMNLFTFLIMGIDKKKAKKGSWRVPEKTLFTLVALGGGIGGIAGMHVFKHKTKKTRFVIGFPLIIIMQIIVVITIFVV